MKYGQSIKKQIVVFEDEGFTGANTNRPQLKKMLDCFEEGNYRMLVVYRLDRISRNVLDFCELKDKLNTLNINFISITENFDTTTPMGNAMLMISSVFAQLERDTIAERIKDNMFELAKTGRWLGGNTPLGYKSNKKESITIDGKKKSLYALDITEDIKIVELIYSKYLNYKSLTKVEDYLNKNHIKTRTNKNFTRFSISEILKNIVYCKADTDIKNFISQVHNTIYDNYKTFNVKIGLIDYNKKNQMKKRDGKRRNIINTIDKWVIAIGEHQGIINGKNWIKVQDILHKKSFTKRNVYRNKQVNSLLSGLIKCELCHSYMRPKVTKREENNTNFFYICELKEKSKRALCKCQNIKGHDIDNRILDKIKNFNVPVFKIKKYLNNYSFTQNDQLFIEQQALTQELAKIDKKINDLITKLPIVNENITKIITEQLDNLAKQKEIIMTKLVNINNTPKCQIDINDIITNYFEAFNYFDLEEKRELIKTVFSLILGNGKDLTIYFNTDKLSLC